MSVSMIFKKHHCAKCGAQMVNEKTHRVVTKEDKDYYEYHDVGKFPLRDYHVYEYRLKCPSCHARFTPEEQRAIERFQKRSGQKVLSSAELRESREAYVRDGGKRVLIRRIATTMVLPLIFVVLLFFLSSERTPADLGRLAVIYAVLTPAAVVRVVRKHKGKYTLKYKKTYSYEKEAQLKRLHTYSTHNRALIESADRCYCFNCKRILDSREITAYTDADGDEGQTAVCPMCGVDAIIPDSIEEPLDETLIDEMNAYWF